MWKTISTWKHTFHQHRTYRYDIKLYFKGRDRNKVEELLTQLDKGIIDNLELTRILQEKKGK